MLCVHSTYPAKRQACRRWREFRILPFFLVFMCKENSKTFRESHIKKKKNSQGLKKDEDCDQLNGQHRKPVRGQSLLRPMGAKRSQRREGSRPPRSDGSPVCGALSPESCLSSRKMFTYIGHVLFSIDVLQRNKSNQADA